MNAAEVVLWLAAALGAASLVAPRWRAKLALGHVVLTLGALLVLVLAFLLADVRYDYVWRHGSVAYGVAYRLAGVWGGEEGTILLWAGVVAAVALAVARGDGPLRARAALVLVAFSSTLAFFAARLGVFAPTAAERLALAPGGRGLADVLVTPLMVVHPPVQFVAYGLMAAPAAFALAHLAGRDADARAWVRLAFPWARLAWLFATLGLGLGALWAYYVLSFGGYWAWDPVEASNLVPWLALTAFLHAGKQLDRLGDHPHASVGLAVGAVALTLFATFATRSGLWVSVHAFTDPTGAFEPDAAARLLAILAAHEPTRLFLGLLSFVACASVALFAAHHANARAGGARTYLRAHAAALLVLGGAAALDPAWAWGGLFALGSVAPTLMAGVALALGLLLATPPLVVFMADEGRRRAAWDVRTLLSVAVALLALAVAVTLLLDLQIVNGPDRRAFDVRAPFLALPIVAAITVAMALPSLGRVGSVLLAGGAFAGGLVAWALFPDARVLALATPPLVAAVAATLLRLHRAQGSPGRPRLPAYAAGGVGLVLVALGSNPPVGPDAALGAGAALMLAGAALVVGGLWRLHGRAAWGLRARETGIYVVHLAVLVGLLGYAGSTYSQDREVFTAVAVGAPAGVVGSDDVLVGEPILRASEGRLDAVRVPLEVGGRTAALDMAWRGGASPHYAPRLDVTRGLFEDVYVSPLAFHTDAGWVGAASATPRPVPAGEVDLVTFSVTILPLMTLVWAGLWLSILGMGLVVAGAAWERRRRAHAS